MNPTAQYRNHSGMSVATALGRKSARAHFRVSWSTPSSPTHSPSRVIQKTCWAAPSPGKLSSAAEISAALGLLLGASNETLRVSWELLLLWGNGEIALSPCCWLRAPFQCVMVLELHHLSNCTGWGGVGGIFFNQNIYFRQSAHMLKTWAVVLGVRIEECYKTLFALQATRMWQYLHWEMHNVSVLVMCSKWSV